MQFVPRGFHAGSTSNLLALCSWAGTSVSWDARRWDSKGTVLAFQEASTPAGRPKPALSNKPDMAPEVTERCESHIMALEYQNEDK